MRKKKQQIPNFIDKAQSKLKEHFMAILAEKVVKCLYNKGFEFQTKHDLHNFFKTRVTLQSHEDLSTYFLDQVIPICAFKQPDFTQKGFEVDIKFEFLEL